MAIKIVDSDFQSILSVALSSKFGHSFPKQICISVNFVQIFKNSSHLTKDKNNFYLSKREEGSHQLYVEEYIETIFPVRSN